ncbi:PTS alpha-glucoside transporter subunit IIA [Cryobacterium sp. TMT1-62]|uniref:PTS transporter subunit EIIC n=1 Tax=unclassified Cryobacterium TaxID=2649013 RepID=UPI000CE53CE8|nr:MULTISPECIES: PTS transporter subunit EIIC [unclassified Cryobacterium]TFB56598.1 PTS alpha-glucoside transporter subunit IIA [Cryobacterium sp. Sr3]TFC53820.1 PTS alpha-glucoside transporter subunit IIA [Cryobacterium sp. TMT2-17-1]TFC69954.1 PTS alpha-glucoside transporter subunit IIA [Cryobacterium sp. TMT2-4]TFD33799.1 PTS alpha-glucoside transporter subunit IIA [Cryobacterium sp. TMT1-62]
MADSRVIADQLLIGLGGAENIIDVEKCMTRLRVGVRDQDRVDVAALRAIAGVLAALPGDNCQIVLGPGLVDRVAIDVESALSAARAEGSAASSAAQLADKGAAIRQQNKQRNNTPVKNALRRISNIFVPLIPALIACGLIAGINGILTNLATSGQVPWLATLSPIFSVMSSGFFALLAVFVAMNAAKEFGGTPIIGGVIGGIIVAPGVANIVVWGQQLAPGQGGVLGAMAAAILGAYVERWARRWAPDVLALFIVPTSTVLIAGLAALFLLMPAAGWVSIQIGIGATWLLSTAGVFAGFVLGGLFLPLVMTGLHQTLTPIHTTLIEQVGYTTLLPVLAMGGAGQIGAAIAVFFRLRRNTSIGRTIKSALPAGFLGVGEPLIYGVTLPLGRPFITACIGGAFGGAVIGLFDQLGYTVGAIAIGASDVSLFPLLQGSQGWGAAALGYACGLIVAYTVGFFATWFFGFTRDQLVRLNTDDTIDAGLVPADDVPEGTDDPADQIPTLAGSHHRS